MWKRKKDEEVVNTKKKTLEKYGVKETKESTGKHLIKEFVALFMNSVHNVLLVAVHQQLLEHCYS